MVYPALPTTTIDGHEWPHPDLPNTHAVGVQVYTYDLRDGFHVLFGVGGAHAARFVQGDDGVVTLLAEFDGDGAGFYYVGVPFFDY